VIAIRRLVAPLPQAEAEALSALHRRAFDESEGRWGRGWSAMELAVLAEAPGAILLVVGEADAPLGFALFRIAADEAELLTIATLPEARRRGVAAALLTHALPALGEAGANSIFLEVGATNAAAISLYEKAGFRQIATRRNYYAVSGGGREDALIYKMEISRTR